MLIARNSQAATVRSIPLQFCNLADVYSQYPIAPRNALLDLVLHPLALVGVCANENDTDRRALKLLVDPVLDRGLPLALYSLKIGLVDKPRLRDSGDDVAITNVHRTMDIVILEAEEYFPSHIKSSAVLEAVV